MSPGDEIALSARTRVAAVIGDPIGHSRSPSIHNAGFRAAGLDWRYVAFAVTAGNGAAAVEAMRVLDLAGLSVTMPLKAEVADAVDRRSDAVETLGACNCVFWDQDRLVGDNTDGDGFVRALESESGRRVAGARVAVIGAGGAGRAIIEALGRSGADVVGVVNRTRAAAARAASLSPCAQVVDPVDVPAFDIVVNATSVGMDGGPAPDRSPIAVELLREGQLVADIVYNPRRSRLLADAESAGAATIGGLGMLVHQAVLQFERWTGVPAPVAAMTAAIEIGADPHAEVGSADGPVVPNATVG